MALIVADRILETSTSTGTGAFTLAAAKTGFRRFSSVCAVGDTVYYVIQAEDSSGIATGEWEAGLGTYSSANTLTRTTVQSSSTGSAVSFSAGVKSVWIDVTASEVTKFEVTNDLMLQGSGCGFPTDNSGNFLITLAYNETTRTITITPTGTSFSFYVAGVKYTKVGAQTIVHGTTQGTNYIYYDNTGTLVVGTTLWNLHQTAPVAIVYWDATNSRGLCSYETHHAGRDVFAHITEHTSEGSYLVSGCVVDTASYSIGTLTDAGATFAIGTGVIADEDLWTNIQALPDAGPYTILHKIGAAGDFRISYANTVPFLRSGTNTQYNQFTAGAWQLTSLANNRFVNYYVFAVPVLPTTAITPTPTATRQIIIVPGQAVYTSLALAQAETVSSIDWGTYPFAEIVPLYQVTYRYLGAGGGTTDMQGIVKLVGTKTTLSVASQPATNAANVVYAPTGNIAATNVQDAIDELDTEKEPKQTAATQAEAEAGTVTAIRSWTPERIKQAIAALGGGSQVSFARTFFTATASQTTFSVAYTVGLIQVFVNGAMAPTPDYTANNGTSVVFGSGLPVGTEVEVCAFTSFSVANAIMTTGNQTKVGNFALTGNFSTTGSVGVGGTVSGWTLPNILDVGGASLVGSSIDSYLSANQYYDGVWKYKAAGYGTVLLQTAGNFDFYSAPSGAAGAASTQSLVFRIDQTGKALCRVPTGGIGYGTGSGGVVTQQTSKSTAVTLDRPTGQIITHNAALASGAVVSFTVNNSLVAGTDIIVCNIENVNYAYEIHSMAANSFVIAIKNTNAVSLSQAVVINFAIIKGATS